MKPMLWLLILAIGIGYLTGCRHGNAPAEKVYRLSKITIKLDRDGKYWLDFHDQNDGVFQSFRFLFSENGMEGFGGSEWHVRVTQRKVTPKSFDMALQVHMSWEVRLEFDGITDVDITRTDYSGQSGKMEPLEGGAFALGPGMYSVRIEGVPVR